MLVKCPWILFLGIYLDFHYLVSRVADPKLFFKLSWCEVSRPLELLPGTRSA